MNKSCLLQISEARTKRYYAMLVGNCFDKTCEQKRRIHDQRVKFNHLTTSVLNLKMQ